MFKIEDRVVVSDETSANQGQTGTVERTVVRNSIHFVGEPAPRPIVPPQTIYYVRLDNLRHEAYTLGFQENQLETAALDDLARVIS